MGKQKVKMDSSMQSTLFWFLRLSVIALFCGVIPSDCLHGRSTDNRREAVQGEDLVSCPEGTDLFTTDRTCLSRPSSGDLQSHSSARSTCRKQGGYLATATEPQIEFISERYAINPDKNKTEMNFWMNYIMIHNIGNSSLWSVAQEPDEEPQPQDLPTGMFPMSVPKNLSDKSRVCLQLSLQYNNLNKMESWEFKAEDCNLKIPYMCEKPASSPCIDRMGNIVPEGEHYSPQSRDDPCFRCQCHGGVPGVCSSTWCSKPVCDKFIPDPMECCQYSCLDSNGNVYTPNNNKNGGHTPPFNLGDNMRWVLTMITSFLLLGMMLFMVYRMRQKRLAYLRYRVRRFQEAQMDFEPGSGPPAPSMDDMNGQFFREPPPPYSSYLYLKSTAIHTDAPPPPYQHSCSTQPRRLNLASQRSDEISLLRNSASSSLPASPSPEQTSAPVFLTPPESPVNTSPEGTILTAIAPTPNDSAATTPSEAATVITPIEAATATTPMASNQAMSSFLGDAGQRSPSRNTAV